MKLLKLIQEINESIIKEDTLQTIFKTVEDAKTLRDINPSLVKTFEDIIKFGKAEGKPIEGYTAANKTNRTIINNVDDLVYSIKAGGMEAETIGQFYKGMLKSANTPREFISEIVPEVIKSETFIKEYGKMTPNEMATELRNRKYSDAAIEEILGQTKKHPDWKNTRKVGIAERKAKKTNSGKNSTQTPTTDGSGVPPQQTKTLTEKTKELIDNIKNKKMSWGKLVAWAAGIGIGVTALWWWLYNNSDTIPDGTPETEPKNNNTKWDPCINELIKSGEAQTTTDVNAVIVKPTDFPDGLEFFNNGRVMDIAGKKMGTWKCKGTTAVVNEGTQKISLSGLLNEQGNDTTAADVSTMIDLLDFPVSGDNLKTAGNLLQKYADNGKGKDFLSLYQQSGIGGGDLTKTLNYIYTSEPTSVQAKNRLKQLNAQILSGKGGVTPPVPTTGDKKGLGGIDIIWDGQKKADEKVINPIKKSKYHDCSGKDTFEFGCKSPKIKEIQICLGMEERYQTGNFGPLTKKALEDMSYDTSKGITVEMYNRIKSTCTDNSDVRAPRLDNAKIEPIKTDLTPKAAGINTDNLKMPNIQPVGQGNQGESIYKGLKNNFTDKTLPYIFSSGDRIKYKGDEIGEGSLGQLDQYLSTLGYQRIKEKDKDYGVKYVWAKQ